jgi:hypothetical protein
LVGGVAKVTARNPGRKVLCHNELLIRAEQSPGDGTKVEPVTPSQTGVVKTVIEVESVDVRDHALNRRQERILFPEFP